MEILSSMPLATYERAKKLLKQRGCLRPPETLPLLAEMFLRWQGAIGIPEPGQRDDWDPMIRDFRTVAFDLGPGRQKPWTTTQARAAEDLLLELWKLNLDDPPLQLPAWEPSLKEGERSLLLDWVWTHLDFHYLALTMGVLASGLVKMDTKHEDDLEWLGTIQEQVSLISGLADFLSGPKGISMPVEEALSITSGMLDAMTECLTIAFDRGGLQAHLMARAAGWHSPYYPVSMEEAQKRLPEPESPKRKSRVK